MVSENSLGDSFFRSPLTKRASMTMMMIAQQFSKTTHGLWQSLLSTRMNILPINCGNNQLPPLLLSPSLALTTFKNRPSSIINNSAVRNFTARKSNRNEILQTNKKRTKNQSKKASFRPRVAMLERPRPPTRRGKPIARLLSFAGAFLSLNVLAA